MAKGKDVSSFRDCLHTGFANNSVDEASGSHGMVLCMRVSNDGVIDEYHRTQLFCLHGGCVKHNRGNFNDEKK
jgi:hypothetical protein